MFRLGQRTEVRRVWCPDAISGRGVPPSIPAGRQGQASPGTHTAGTRPAVGSPRQLLHSMSQQHELCASSPKTPQTSQVILIAKTVSGQY